LRIDNAFVIIKSSLNDNSFERLERFEGFEKESTLAIKYASDLAISFNSVMYSFSLNEKSLLIRINKSNTLSRFAITYNELLRLKSDRKRD
jgi:hypothetical protein